MAEDGVAVWLVQREFTDKGLLTLVYATTDGERKLVEQRSATRLADVTAGQTVSPERLDPTEPSNRDRFATEATRMAEHHDQDDDV